MRDSEKPKIHIGSFAAPTPEDLDQLEGLTESWRRELIAWETQRGIDSGVSKLIMEDIWTEALPRVKEKARASGALWIEPQSKLRTSFH